MKRNIMEKQEVTYSKMQRSTKLKLGVALLLGSVYLGIQGKDYIKPLKEIFSYSDENLTKEEMEELVRSIEQNKKLTEEEKQMFVALSPVFEEIPYINFNETKEELRNLDIVEDRETKTKNMTDWNPVTKELTIYDENASLNQAIFDILSGSNNGNFIEKGMSQVLANEYFGENNNSEYRLITQMLEKTFGMELMIQSYMSNKNLLQEEIAKTVDPYFSKVFFDELEKYDQMYQATTTTISQVELQKQLELILEYFDIIYQCKTDQPLEMDDTLDGYKEAVLDIYSSTPISRISIAKKLVR